MMLKCVVHYVIFKPVRNLHTTLFEFGVEVVDQPLARALNLAGLGITSHSITLVSQYRSCVILDK